MRELKESSAIAHPVITLLYRVRRKRSGYVWLEVQGKLYLEQSKSRKCVILVGRERPIYKLSWSDLREVGGLGEREFWSKISSDGMFLYNTPAISRVIGQEAEALRGRNLSELVEAHQITELLKALKDAAAGKSVRLRYKLRNSRGGFVDVITNFYPNSQPKSSPRKTTAGVVHPSIVAQTNEYSSEMGRRATKDTHASSLPNPKGIGGSPGMPQSRPNLLRVDTGGMRDMMLANPETTGSGGDSGDASGSVHSPSLSGSDSSAPSTFSTIPSTYKALVQQSSTQGDNVFDELETTGTTSWQYELHQLKLTNKKLKEELHMIQAARRKKRKKEDIQSGKGVSSLPASISTAQPKACANCSRMDSPELVHPSHTLMIVC